MQERYTCDLPPAVVAVRKQIDCILFLRPISIPSPTLLGGPYTLQLPTGRVSLPNNEQS